MEPLISIVSPVYNAAKYLDETIASVFAQTYTNWELIMVNDGSKDDSEQVILKYTDDRIKYLKKTNGGVSTARNMGIKAAKGDYIAFLDADDFWLPDNLEKKVTLAENNNIDWVFSDMYEVDENLQNRIYAPKGQDEDFLNKILLWTGEVIPGPASNLVVHKRCFADGLLFDPEFSTAADQDFTLYLSAKYKGQRLAEPLWLYRQIGSSMSRNIAVMEKDHVGVYKKAERRGLFKSYWFKQKCFAKLYFILAGSWWVNGQNKRRGLYFLVKSVFTYPPGILRVVRKVVGA